MPIYDPDTDPCLARLSAHIPGLVHRKLESLELTDPRDLQVYIGTVLTVLEDGAMLIALEDPQTGRLEEKILCRSQLTQETVISSVPWPVTVKAPSFESIQFSGWIMPSVSPAEPTVAPTSHYPQGNFGDGEEKDLDG